MGGFSALVGLHGQKTSYFNNTIFLVNEEFPARSA